MLELLVTSKARRRVLALLWGRGEAGSAADLAKRAGIGFASAYRELRAMQRAELVVSSREGGAEVYRANASHPLANALRALIAEQPAAREDDKAQALRAHLRALGAPLAGDETELPRDSIEETVVEGVRLAHRDPAVARTLPICLFKLRDRLDPGRLEHFARRLGEKQSLGLFLDLTSTLSRDRRFATWARALKDRRWRATHDFFYAASSPIDRQVADVRTPTIARRWGFRMNMDLDAFRMMFDRFAHAA